MAGEMVLQSARLVLTPVMPEDAAETACLMTPAISEMLTTWPGQMSVEQVARRIADSIEEREARLWVDWALRLIKTGELIGWLGLGRRLLTETDLTFGIWLGEKFQGQRLGEEAVSAVMHYATPCATSFRAQIFQRNLRSIGLFENLGFQRSEEQDVYSPVREESTRSYLYVLPVKEGLRLTA